VCGIAGFVGRNNQETESSESVINEMLDSLAHRGPDDRGIWVDRHSRLVLGHRRLSIIDLSFLGKQPMSSIHGRYKIVFNGEIYNFKHIRKELEQFRTTFRGYSDTEVLLAAIEHWGIDAAIKKTVGMFAIAIWDSKNKTITLVRDRLGEKTALLWMGRKHFCFCIRIKGI